MVNLIRDGQKVWPYCTECGCRLNLAVMEEWTWLFHYGNGEKDARGCNCSLVAQNLWVETDLIYQDVV